MIPRSLTGAALAALFTVTAHLSAAPTASPGYAAIPFYTHAAAASIVSYDWAGGSELYYQTSASFTYGGLYQWKGGTLTTLEAANGSIANGASVVTIGDYVYANLDTYTATPIRKFGPISGSPALNEISLTTNYALFGHGGDLLITGAPGFGPSQIYYSDLDLSGNLVPNPALSLGTPGGAPGPLAFDSAGNLFYAPGFFDKSIYRWTAAQLAAAIADPLLHPLTTAGQLWLDYSTLYPAQGGATSMLIEADGNLLLTLTDFVNPSYLTRFDAALDGRYAGTREDLLTSTALLGQLRTHHGGLYLSSENAIYQIVPEPGTALLLALALPLLALRRRRP